MEYLSKQRYDEISAELKHLTDVVYPKVKDDLAEARAQGDLSENAGYREARRIQAKTISRIRFLQKVLEHSRVLSPEMNLEAGKISLKSPVGAALMGKKVGEIAEARIPSGIMRLRIEKITPGQDVTP